MKNINYYYSCQRSPKIASTVTRSFTKVLTGLLIIVPAGYIAEAKVNLVQAESTPSISLDKKIIYVNPEKGSDTEVGKKSTPLKTITHALSVAKQGTTIKLSPGTYSEATGEIFPLIIKNHITLEGETKNQGYKTIIEGNGYFISPTGAGQNVAIAAIQDAGGIIGLTITNKHSRGHGLWIESADPQVTRNTFTRNGNTGVSVNGTSNPRIADNYFYNNSGNGLLVYGNSQPDIVENTFEQTGFGVSVVQQASANLEDNLFDGNRIGAIFEGKAQGTLRNNKFINSEESGLTAIAQSQVDLGNSNQRGNNTFRSNKKLDILNASKHQIIAVGTEIHGKTEGDISLQEAVVIASQKAVPEQIEDLQSTNQNNSPLTAKLPALSEINPPQNIETTVSEPIISLPEPPPILENSTENKELVFTPEHDSIATALNIEPVPYPPEVTSTSLQANNNQIDSLSDVLGGSRNLVKYKVLVETLSESEEQEVKAIYPEAFKTIYQGDPWLQVGAFNNWDKAKQAERTLVNLGLATYLIE